MSTAGLAGTRSSSVIAGILGLVGVVLFVVATLIPFAGGLYPERRLAPAGLAAFYFLVTTHLWIVASAAVAAASSLVLLRTQSILASGLLAGVGVWVLVEIASGAIGWWATGGFEPGSVLMFVAAIALVVGGLLGRPAGPVPRGGSVPAALAAAAGGVAVVVGSFVPYIVQLTPRGEVAQADTTLEGALQGSFGASLSALALVALVTGTGGLVVRLAMERSGWFLGALLAGIGFLLAATYLGHLVFSLRSPEFRPALGSYLLVAGGVLLAWAGVTSVGRVTTGSSGGGRPEPRPAAEPAS
jgi:hypothetical protein